MVKPTKPTPPDRALRSTPGTFSANAEAWITYQWGTFPNYIDAAADFVDARADEALAAALGGDLPSLTAKGGQALFVKLDETGAEFLDAATARARLGAAALASPALTGTPTAPNAAASTNTTQIATTAYTRTAIPDVLNASGSAPVYAARAWVNFNGTGTVAIRASGNVSSITDNGVGDYNINLTTAMPDTNYAALISQDSVSRPGAIALIVSTSTFQVLTHTGNTSGSASDREQINVVAFR